MIVPVVAPPVASSTTTAGLVAAFVVGLFGLGAVVLAVGTHFGRLDARTAWGRFALEFGIVAFVAVPPAFGVTAVRATAAPLVAVLVLEVAAVGGLPRGMRGVLASLVAAVSVVDVPPAIPMALAVVSPLVLGLAVAGVRHAVIGLAVVAPWAFGSTLVALARTEHAVVAVDSAYAVLETSDSAAYLLGGAFGRTLFWPRVSTKKTRTGVIAALVTGALVGGVAAPLLFGTSPLVGGVVGTAGASAASAADLATSALKRKLGCKDFAAWMPHHGSASDAYDSLIFVLPLWMLVRAILG
ncbi:MAG: phosphatidate cytidylyltransferase [Polyangiaceae bacterium]